MAAKILTDNNGNRCSVDYWGTEAAAQKALDSLKNCSHCSDCSDCYDCYDCSGCSHCYNCYDCSRCSRCSDCSDCSGCYDCSRCSRCSDCSGCCDCCDSTAQKVAAPPIPVVPDIHKRVYAAALKGLNMGSWHTCDTTHCRGGWVTTLAGEQGKALEDFHGTLPAAMLIYEQMANSSKASQAYS